MEQHNLEIHENRLAYEEKPVLRNIYAGFHRLIAKQLSNKAGITAELGSGGGNIKATIPECLLTDLFENPWIDQVENACALSWEDDSVANLILFDVFHHIRYPGTALAEFNRVLKTGGRVIIFEPCVSLLGRLVYGLLHPEPLGLGQKIDWLAPLDWSPDNADYYAAQGNAWRIFGRKEFPGELSGWNCKPVQRFSAISYVASGGFSGPQLYPDAALGLLQGIDRIADLMPTVFATRMLVVLEKVGNSEAKL